ncbi:hypothetical protein AB6818_13040 [Carnobacterium maltaromaticum]|uniref:hypothetical protein n=1 Tax=Carnobacterium maltaromaticum TaxID=2751 RepID=UPI0039BDDF34
MLDLLEEASADNGFKELSQKIPAKTLYSVITILNETQGEMRFSNHPDIYLEVATVKMTQLRNEAPAVIQEVPTQQVDRVQESSGNANTAYLESELAALKKQLQEMKEQGFSGGAAKTAPAKVQKKVVGGQFKPNIPEFIVC